MASVEWLSVARPTSRHCGSKRVPEPQLTISGSSAEVISKLSVPAWAVVLRGPSMGGAASAITETAGLASRGGKAPSPAPLTCVGRTRDCTSAVTSRPGAPRPPPWTRARLPSRWRRLRSVGAIRPIAASTAGTGAWPASARSCEHPGEQDEDLQQVLGIARGDAALGVDLAGAFPDQRVGGGRGKLFFSQPMSVQAE